VPAGLAQALTCHRPTEVSSEACKREQSRIAGKRLYLLAVFYTGLLAARPAACRARRASRGRIDFLRGGDSGVGSRRVQFSSLCPQAADRKRP
jgi:hypothetical protein